MRVALVIYGSLDTITGGYIYDRILIDFLRSKNVEVKIFSQLYRNFYGLICNNFSKQLIADLLEFSPDVVLQDSMNYASLFLLNKKLKQKLNCPIVCVVHLLQSSIEQKRLRKFFIQKIENRYLETLDAFIFNSMATKKLVTTIIGDNISSIIAYPGKDRLNKQCNNQKFSNNSLSDKLQIIFIGNIIFNKGLHILLNALYQIDTKLWQLSVVGGMHDEDKYTNQILKMITDLQLNNNVKMLGVLQPESLRKLMLDHHLLAVPSSYESFGIVYAEAMGAGLPVIATSAGGASEIVTDTINGFLVSPGDIDRLRNVILKLINDRSLLMQMSLSSFNSYQKMPTWNESMQLIYDFLHSHPPVA